MMNRWTGICALMALSVAGAAAQEKPAQPQEKPAPAQALESVGRVPLKVTVVISRFQGDKKTSSLPYVLGVTANSQATTLRMGIQVPIVATSQKAGTTQVPFNPFSYREVGTNIDCLAETAPGGLYNLGFVVEDSSVHLNPGEKPGSAAVMEEIPSFRTFKVSFTALMREGQTTQYTSATDPVTGEVMKVDVTLDGLK
ncbi:MAG: hypothetical protein ACRD15_05770 [Vicinamibacterales bacterium]